ncbi:MAG: GvpL/GvpF family gas vesicle protein [Dehalococcoidia bacterium]
MTQSTRAQRQPRSRTASASHLAGRYVYCVARASERVSLGAIGIEGHEVYTAVHDDLCALVHDCMAQPYQSDDAEVAAAWVLAHHQVVDTAWKRWGTVLPLTFNTIIGAADGRNAEDNLAAWLGTEYELLKGRLEALAGKAEYGIQVFRDPEVVAGQVAKNSPEIRRLEEEIGSKPRGIAYMYRQKLERLLKNEIETRAAEEFKELYGGLSRCVDNIRVEKTKQARHERQMLMNLSCLVSTERYPDLEAELDRVGNMKGFFVRVAGPLPPYSFC